ncbi:MAG TPA: hypothetical protein VHR42_07825, partial [Clostridia bacterium]|nr:hypothetical protein [Clostridia bacterium]
MVLSIFSLDTVGASAATYNPVDSQYYNNGATDQISLDLVNGPVVLLIDSGMNAFFQGSFQEYNSSQVTIHTIDSGDSVR